MASEYLSSDQSGGTDAAFAAGYFVNRYRNGNSASPGRIHLEFAFDPHLAVNMRLAFNGSVPIFAA
jgi:hypothetical protein